MSRIPAKAVVPAAVLLLLIAGVAGAAPPDPRADLAFETDSVGVLFWNIGARTIYVEVRIDAYQHEGDALVGGGVTAAYIEAGQRMWIVLNEPGLDKKFAITQAEYRSKPMAQK